MACLMERCGFFDANLVGEEYDRVYLSQHFAAYFASFIGNGVFRENAGELQVMALSTPQMKVSVLGGQGYINGYWYENTDNLILNIDNADGVLNRIDSVVLRLGYAERDMWLAVKKGTPAINPIAPSLTRSADYYELQLATISIPASSISIVQSRISDTRFNSNVCGIVTGLVEQADPTEIFTQFEAWYEQTKNNYDDDIANWTQQQKDDFDSWVHDQTYDYTNWTNSKKEAFDNWYLANTTEFMNRFNSWYNGNTTMWEEDFNDWFNSLQNALDENVAANLYLNIEDHKSNKNNPHDVDKEQVGLPNVTNEKQATEVDFIEHKTKSVTSNGGVHDFRVVERKAQFYNIETGLWENVKAGTEFKVGNVTITSVKASDKTVEISWKDPDNLIASIDGVDVTFAEWGGTLLKYSEDTNPENEKEGILAVDNKVKDQYEVNGFLIENLENDIPIYISLFPYTIDGTYTIDDANMTEATPAEKLPQSPPQPPSISDLTFESVKVDGGPGTEVRLGAGVWHDSPYTFTGLAAETQYSVYARYKETETHFASDISSAKTFTTPSEVDDQTDAPGPKNLISGTMALGFFGEVSASELITGNNLASQTGVTQGSAQFSDTPWLKFASEGKILFVAKKSIRSAISWDAINTAKCVYGDEGDKVIVQNGHSYKVRLLKGANPVFNPKAPINGQSNGGDGYSKEVNHYSEWNKLMCAIHTEAPTKAWAYPDNVEATLEVLTHDLGSGANGMYTDQDLHTHNTHGDGTYCWCQEMTTSTSSRLYRGYTGVSGAGSGASSTTYATRGWRPVLEFIA